MMMMMMIIIIIIIMIFIFIFTIVKTFMKFHAGTHMKHSRMGSTEISNILFYCHLVCIYINQQPVKPSFKSH